MVLAACDINDGNNKEIQRRKLVKIEEGAIQFLKYRSISKIQIRNPILNLTGVFWIIDWLNWNNYNDGKKLNGCDSKIIYEGSTLNTK